MMRVIELRNYLLRDGMTRDFLRYFEEHFLFSQREAGMHVLGQFEVVDAPSRFSGSAASRTWAPAGVDSRASTAARSGRPAGPRPTG